MTSGMLTTPAHGQRMFSIDEATISPYSSASKLAHWHSPACRAFRTSSLVGAGNTPDQKNLYPRLFPGISRQNAVRSMSVLITQGHINITSCLIKFAKTRARSIAMV